MMTVYKLAQKLQNGSYGSYAIPLNSLYHINYSLGATQEAPIGGIFTFDNLKDAEDFCGNISDIAILKCEVDEKDEIPIPKFLGTIVDESSIRKAWEINDNESLKYIKSLTPSYFFNLKGTRLFKRVTPVAVVEEFE